MFKKIAEDYFLNRNYNCAEAMLRAANDYYGLGLSDHDMILVGGFGGGIQTGSTCGAILSAVGVISMKYVEAKAHESTDIKPVTALLLKNFTDKLGSTLCCDIKPKYFVEGVRCLAVILAACDIIEETISEYEASKVNE